MINRRTIITLAGGVLTTALAQKSFAGSYTVIDDFGRTGLKAQNGAAWQFVTDGVMGGVSKGTIRREKIAGRNALRMQGLVRLENNGGFIQAALDLSPDGSAIDASVFSGIEIDVSGNDEIYNFHLRTDDLTRPWQSYRHSFKAEKNWIKVRLPFAGFAPYRTDAPFNPAKLRRIGIVAIGRPFQADIAIGLVRFYK